MSEEMQAEAIEPTEQLVETDNLDMASESSADSGENHEAKVTFDEAQQRVMDRVIAEKTFKTRKAERELADYKAQHTQSVQPVIEQRPVVPELPDPYDVSEDEFRQTVANRDAALVAANNYDVRQHQVQQNQVFEQQNQQNALIKQQEDLSQSYSDTAKKVGFDEARILQDAQAIQGFGGFHPTAGVELAQHIMRDEQGASINAYLAKNPIELMNIQAMEPMVAYNHIMSSVKTKAATMAPKPTSAPAPAGTLSGSGVPHNDRGRFTQNATFE